MDTDKFKLPRKLKKKIKGIWVYPPDEKGNRLMAWPTKSEKDFEAYRAGKLERLGRRRSIKERKEYVKKLNQPIEISDIYLKTAIEDIIRKEHRNSSYNTLKKAKNSKKAIEAYYNFVNAYHLYKNGEDSYGNICCLSIDRARELLKS